MTTRIGCVAIRFLSLVLLLAQLTVAQSPAQAVPGMPLPGAQGQREADANQQADTAAQESMAQTTSISPFATTACSYYFTSGSGNTFLDYCVTANGNIPFIYTPFDHLQIGQTSGDREGYGICNESPAQNYTDYGTHDTGNWNAATLVSQGSTFVKIARTTSDNNWTLTQTITIVPSSSSIKIVMALTNNQAVAKVAYLVRYAYVNADSYQGNIFGATLNSAFAWDGNVPAAPAHYGLQLQNVGTPQFGYWQAFAQTVPSGPNACAFAFNDSGGYFSGDGSVVMAYVGSVPTHRTKTVTLTYRGM